MVFRFFTGERCYRFSWHRAGIVDIEWIPDDSGFVSSDKNAHLQLWSLKSQEPLWTNDTGKKHVTPYYRKFNTFSSTCISVLPCEVPSKLSNNETVVWSVCTDGTITEICDSQDRCRVEMGIQLSEICMLRGDKDRPRAFFGGACATGPGSVRMLSYPSWEMSQSVQVSSGAITRLALNYE